MKILFLDCYSGAAGDMLLAALVNAGADEKLICDLPGRLGLANLTPTFETVSYHGIAGLQFKMPLPNHGVHRHLSHITDIIARADLSEKVGQMATDAFTRLAEAEAAVHATTPEKVHFHEVGADDALIDIVGYFLLLENLGWPNVYCSPLNFGHGTIPAAHGMIPLPGPATVRLLEGIPVSFVDWEGETVTPTGAALLAASAVFTKCPQMKIKTVGYGAGSRQFEDRVNMVRAVIGEAVNGIQTDTVTILETNIDDMNPQIYDHLFHRLYENGALEAFLTPVLMKKSRPGIVLTVLCLQDKVLVLQRIIFTETTSSGIRYRESQRAVLPRRIEEVVTEYGKIHVKIFDLDGSSKYLPEYDDCRAAARIHNVTLNEIIMAVQRNYDAKG